MKEINCNLCGEKKGNFLYKTRDRMIRRDSGQEFNLVVCGNCGLGYLNPQPEWKELEYFYGDNYYTNDTVGFKKSNIAYALLRKIKRFFFGLPNPKFWNFNKESGKFLDVGCGNGAYESYAIRNHPGWEFYGVEPSRYSAEIAKTIQGLHVFEGSLEEAHYDDNFFDVIFVNHVLEHVPDPARELSECYRILKPDGHLVIGVPNFNSPARRIFGTYWLHLDSPRHLFHFSDSAIKALLNKCGFRIDSLRYEVITGSIIRSVAYRFHMDKFFFEKPLLLYAMHLVIRPINKIIEVLKLASGLRIIAIKKI